LAKAFSIGLNSRVKLQVQQTGAPSLDGLRMLASLWAGKFSMTTTSRRAMVGTSTYPA
jgi:hypothetical protein